MSLEGICCVFIKDSIGAEKTFFHWISSIFIPHFIQSAQSAVLWTISGFVWDKLLPWNSFEKYLYVPFYLQASNCWTNYVYTSLPGIEHKCGWRKLSSSNIWYGRRKYLQLFLKYFFFFFPNLISDTLHILCPSRIQRRNRCKHKRERETEKEKRIRMDVEAIHWVHKFFLRISAAINCVSMPKKIQRN